MRRTASVSERGAEENGSDSVKRKENQAGERISEYEAITCSFFLLLLAKIF